MVEMTPERSRRRGRIWAVAAVVLCAVGMLLRVMGFWEVMFPISLAMLVCFMFSGERHGWAGGYRAAEEKFAHAARCDEVVAPMGPHDHEHRCVHPALDCELKRGRPEHLCRCNMRWIDRDDRSEVRADCG